MNFYIINDLSQEKYQSQAIDVTSMSKMFKDISKKDKKMKLDNVMGSLVIFLDEGKFSQTNPNLEHFGEFKVRKKITNYALVKPGKEFFVTKKDDSYTGKVVNGILIISGSEKILELEAQELNKFKGLSAEEKKVIYWLEHGETGKSSLTMCAAMYPQLKGVHHKLLSDDVSVPRDASDMRRCLAILKEVPESRQKLSMVKSVNSNWSKLIENWDAIEEKDKNNDYKGCTEIIERCNLESSLNSKLKI